MKSNLKAFSLSIAATAALAFSACAATDAPPADTNASGKPALTLDQLLPDPVIVKARGFEIKRSQLDQVVGTLKASLMAKGQTVADAQVPQIEQQLLDNLIQTRILVLAATDAQKAKGEADGELRYQSIRTNAPSDEALNRQLKARGFTPEKLKSDLTDEATAQAVMLSKVTVSDDQVKKFYDDNPSKFEVPEVADVAHILITTKDPNTGVDLTDDEKQAKLKLIGELLKRARGGEDFGTLAREYSDDRNSKDRGGEVKISSGGYVPPEFEAAAFSLKTNQISDVVTTVYGYHIIKLLGKTAARRLEFKEVQDNIKTYLQQQQAQKILPKLYAQWKKDSDVQILDPDLKELEDMADKQAATAPPSAGSTP
jgi:parvulin-like peptidyl-prolyl isomerase